MEQRRNSAASRVASEEDICSWVLLQVIFNSVGQLPYQFQSGVEEASVCMECDVGGL